jgi:hypothetical protein
VSKPKLSVDLLISSGFERVGCWELDKARNLAHGIDLPAEAGVYAFAIDGVVQYVGLASKSVRQRLAFYRKPGATQPTNIRLNEIIRGNLGNGLSVDILLAHPPDHEWNGMPIKGAEGLEAGLIECFELPWNMRGTQRDRAAPSKGESVRLSNITSRVLDLVKQRSAMTELEIAKAIYGPSGVQQQVNPHCRALVKSGKIERRGSGGSSDPYTYRAVDPRSGPG